MTENQPNWHLKKIDFLKGIAILLLFIYHCQSALYPGFEVYEYHNSGFIDIPDLKGFILNFSPAAFGWTGGTLFLLTGGFLIHLGYLRDEKNFNVLTFYTKRFWRIYPPYILTLLFFSFTTGGGVGYYFLSKEGLKDFTLHLLSLHNFSDKTFYSINPSLWSFALLTQIYLLYPVFLYFRREAGIKLILLVTLFISLCSLVSGIAFNQFNTEYAYSNSVFKLWYIWIAGAYVAEQYFNGKRVVPGGGVVIALTGFIFLVIVKFNIHSHYLAYYISTFAWVVFIDWFLTFKFKPAVIRNYVSPMIISIGLCSYSIYLVHHPFLTSMLDFFNIFSSDHTFLALLKIVPVFVIIFLVSYSLYYLVEIRSIKLGYTLKNRKMRTWQQ